MIEPDGPWDAFGLFPCGDGQAIGECENCYDNASGRWYADEWEGFSEWFLCDVCAESIRQGRGKAPPRDCQQP